MLSPRGGGKRIIGLTGGDGADGAENNAENGGTTAANGSYNKTLPSLLPAPPPPAAQQQQRAGVATRQASAAKAGDKRLAKTRAGAAGGGSGASAGSTLFPLAPNAVAAGTDSSPGTPPELAKGVSGGWTSATRQGTGSSESESGIARVEGRKRWQSVDGRADDGGGDGRLQGASARAPATSGRGARRGGAAAGGTRGGGKRGGAGGAVDAGGRGGGGRGAEGRDAGKGGRRVSAGARSGYSSSSDLAGNPAAHPSAAPSAAAAANGTSRALSDRDHGLLGVFLNTVNEFLPLISSDVVAAMRDDIVVDGMNGASKKRRRLSPGSGGSDTDFERFARSSLIEAALSVGALVTRDRVAAVGFAENARQLLKEIFDVPSEEAASAFLCLAYFNTYSGEALRADLYLVQAHSFCLNLPEFPLNLEICIEHLSHGRLKIELRPNFHTWGNRRYRVLHVANHVLSMLTQTGDRGLPAALQAGDPLAFEGGEAALLRCVEELVTCIRISERDTLARLICSSLVGLLLMLLGRREESIAVAESVAEGVTPTPAITRVMPLSWIATTVTSALLFIYERHGVYSRLYELVAPAQRLSGSAGQERECALPLPGSDVGEYLRHTCRPSTFCQLVVTISRLTDRGTKNFCPTPDASQGASQDDRWPAMSGLFNNTGGGLVGSAAAGAGARRADGGGGGGDTMRGGGVPRGADVDKAEEECAGTQLAELLASLPPASPPKLSGLVDVESYTDLPSHMDDLAEGAARGGSGGLGGGGGGGSGGGGGGAQAEPRESAAPRQSIGGSGGGSGGGGGSATSGSMRRGPGGVNETRLSSSCSLSSASAGPLHTLPSQRQEDVLGSSGDGGSGGGGGNAREYLKGPQRHGDSDDFGIYGDDLLGSHAFDSDLMKLMTAEAI
ncbi:hypothetical protein Esi_0064_0109 [Ectocarpus siliculosus]|uniref:Uncharacterized protein n=1 Tax=Ectocarpus siliculosus TaxID=2880 RepID=D8LRD8_ECTSI|nr:hypothetical protein Esi_0064_0109 [Ectocarpus siliculosus]|eukprot:CBN75043.1 hypothetical protein Esi_0064_0109 [Ectocarpus siliculosus]